MTNNKIPDFENSKCCAFWKSFCLWIWIKIQVFEKFKNHWKHWKINKHFSKTAECYQTQHIDTTQHSIFPRRIPLNILIPNTAEFVSTAIVWTIFKFVIPHTRTEDTASYDYYTSVLFNIFNQSITKYIYNSPRPRPYGCGPSHPYFIIRSRDIIMS